MAYMKTLITHVADIVNRDTSWLLNLPGRSTTFVRTLTTIGALWCSYQAFNILRFTHLYLIRPSSLQRYLSPPYTSSTPSKNDPVNVEPWALVTGSSDGIGLGFAGVLLFEGCNIILHGRNQSKLEAVRSKLLTSHPTRQIRILVLDADTSASDPATLESAAATLSDISLRILINNVGGPDSTRSAFVPLAARSSEEIRQFIDINARFTTEITRVVLPHLIAAQPSLILTIGSGITEPTLPIPYLGIYAGAKAYTQTLARTLRMEMLAEGLDIEVLHLQIGQVATDREIEAGRSVGWLTPSQEALARAGLDRIGTGRSEVWAYWSHAIMFGAVGLLPRQVAEWVLLRMLESEKARMQAGEKKLE